MFALSEIFQDVQQPGNQTNLRSRVSFVLVECVWPVFYLDTTLPITVKCVNPSASRMQHLVLLYASAQLYKSKVKTNVWYQKSFQCSSKLETGKIKGYILKDIPSFGVVTKVVESTV